MLVFAVKMDHEYFHGNVSGEIKRVIFSKRRIAILG